MFFLFVYFFDQSEYFFRILILYIFRTCHISDPFIDALYLFYQLLLSYASVLSLHLQILVGFYLFDNRHIYIFIFDTLLLGDKSYIYNSKPLIFMVVYFSWSIAVCCFHFFFHLNFSAWYLIIFLHSLFNFYHFSF